MKQALWSFSRRERQGIILLVLLIVFFIYLPDWWMKIQPEVVTIKNSTLIFIKKNAETPLPLFYFDPNTASEKDWVALGISQKLIKTIQHYLSKGGQFRKKDDLKKIYGFTATDYTRLENYIHIKQQQQPLPKQPPKSLIDINTADSATFESLKGIGPTLASRIIKFRQALGGFYSIQQLKEVYALSDSTFKNIQQLLTITIVSLKKLDLNESDEKTLAQHPYIRHKLARLIVLYRSNNGPFRSPEALLGIPLVDDSIYRKIEHYIKTTTNTPL